MSAAVKERFVESDVRPLPIEIDLAAENKISRSETYPIVVAVETGLVSIDHVDVKIAFAIQEIIIIPILEHKEIDAFDDSWGEQFICCIDLLCQRVSV